MRSIRRTVVAAAASGVLAAGAFTALAMTASPASAGIAGSCSGTGKPISCSVSALSIVSPQSIELNATSSPSGQSVSLKWTAECSLNGQNSSTSGGGDDNTTAWEVVSMGFTNPDSCVVTASATLPATDSAAANAPSLTLNVDYNPQAGTASSSPSPSASPVPNGLTGPIKGFAGKCVDDRSNSSSLRAVVQIWTCKRGDKSQVWEYSSGELMHNKLCLNVKGNAGSGGKLILWTCNRGGNEQWLYTLNHTYELLAHGFTLCLDDPGSSTKDGTQLMVYRCHNSANEHWSLP